MAREQAIKEQTVEPDKRTPDADDAAERRRARYENLPSIDPEDMTVSEPGAPPPSDPAHDDDHEFITRYGLA